MRLVHIGGNDEGRWKWFTVPGTDSQVELYCATVEEYTQVKAKFAGDTLGFCREVGKRFFRSFRNMSDQAGEPIQNTPEMRAAILQAQDVFNFVWTALGDAAKWREEGNAGSGSAS